MTIMSTKPIFVATHPRACSTAFERVSSHTVSGLKIQGANALLQVFMTRLDIIRCVHEPFGDAFYFGPERLSARYENDEKAREESGFAESTYETIVERIEREGNEVWSTSTSLRHGHPPSIAPYLSEPVPN